MMTAQFFLKTYVLSLLMLSCLPQSHAERWLNGICGQAINRDTDIDSDNGTPTGGGEADRPLNDGDGSDSEYPTIKGLMTRWQTPTFDIPPGSCQMTQEPSIAQGSTWLDPYITNGTRACAVPTEMFQNGLECGTCYEITYTGEPATNPGRAGKATVQVINHGDIMGFDCQPEVFQEITGATGGIFPIYFKRVDCIYTPPTVVVLTGDNAFYTKVLVVGGHTGVKAVSMDLGGTRYTLSKLSGATWSTKLPGTTSAPTTFHITYRDDTKEVLSDCFGGKWPVPTTSQCS